MEKLVYNRLTDFLYKKEILYEKQFGFHSNHSTDYAILSIIDKIQLSIDEKSYSCGIFLDFKKALNTVDHSILIKKLDKLGIRGLANKWFVSYLTNRKQYVYLDNTISDYNTVCLWYSSGVSAGSSFIFALYERF